VGTAFRLDCLLGQSRMTLSTSTTVAGGTTLKSVEVLLEEEDSGENQQDGMRQKVKAVKFCP